MALGIDAVAVYLNEVRAIQTREDIDLILRSSDRLFVVMLQDLNDYRRTIAVARYYGLSTHLPICNHSVLSLSNLATFGIKHNVFEGNLGH